jgi:hypothetical protein
MLLTPEAVLFWLSKGRIVNEPDVSATAMFLDLGALDSVDYFADEFAA